MSEQIGTMNKLREIYVRPLKSSKFINPLSMKFMQNGKEKQRDIMMGPNRVNVLLYNTSRNVLIFIKQFRPVIYINNLPQEEVDKNIDAEKYPAENGITLELCGGIINENSTSEEAAISNVLKKCNYKISNDQLQKIIKYPSGVGVMTKMQTLFYCEVVDAMRISAVMNKDDEIEVLEMSVPEVREYIQKKCILSPSSFLFGIYWFLQNKINE